MAVRVRKSVWSLPPGDPTLSWYRRAVAELIGRPASDPSSWRYLAAIHGVPQGMPVPGGAQSFWDQCQHQSWFFLPWHRGYIASFEAVIAQTIIELGGPEEWALPYWNYSEDLATNSRARLMPPDFFNRVLPDGSPNALFSRRAAVQNGDFNLDDGVVTLDALQLRDFANAMPGVPSGFGGPVTGFHTFGGDNGGLENLPHNRVHVQIGGRSGFMSDPATAALDPIFWLHHCNIDRLWEVWRNQGEDFLNPTSPQWRSGVSFPMHDANRKPFTFTSGDMLDTTKVLHGYQYDTVPVAHEPAVGREMAVAMADEEHPELAGANTGPVQLEGAVTRTIVSVRPERTGRPGLESARAKPKHVYLNLENITGAGVPGDFKVYIDMPDDDKEPMLAGVMTTFGLAQASDPDREHGGSGLNQVFEITEQAEKLGLTRGNISRLRVSFVREGVQPTNDHVPPGLEDYVRAAPSDSSIQVGRVSLFYR
jgi:tyrosinase